MKFQIVDNEINAISRYIDNLHSLGSDDSSQGVSYRDTQHIPSWRIDDGISMVGVAITQKFWLWTISGWLHVRRVKDQYCRFKKE